MQLRIHFKPELVIDIPETMLKAYDEKHFLLMLIQHVHQIITSPDADWFHFNETDLDDIKKWYRRFHRKL